MTLFGGFLLRRASKIVLFILFISLLLLLTPQAPRGLKKAPTDFSTLTVPTTWSSVSVLPKRVFRNWAGPSGCDIDERYLFIRRLGSGAEGNVKLYNDTYINRAVAVKTFHSHQRNNLPKQLADMVRSSLVTSWPAEIPATILLGGSQLELYDQDLFEKHRPFSARLDTVPALDYFLVPTGGLHPSGWEWQLVMPYLGQDYGDGQGTLTHLMTHLEGQSKSFVVLDNRLRPGLHRLLESLARLHMKGFCHNDIKPDNVYVQGVGNWLLGDLGNVREVNHPYYKTKKWKLEGQWSNCIHNDVRRAIISYLTLIRRASADLEEFDNQFFCRNSALSTLYWDFVHTPTSATGLLDRLQQRALNVSQEDAYYCPHNLPPPMTIRSMGLHRLILTHMVDSVLHWSTQPSRLRIWLSHWNI